MKELESAPGCKYTEWCDASMGILCLDCQAKVDLKQRFDDMLTGAQGGTWLHGHSERFNAAIKETFDYDVSIETETTAQMVERLYVSHVPEITKSEGDKWLE